LVEIFDQGQALSIEHRSLPGLRIIMRREQVVNWQNRVRLKRLP
jgi:hypothetical protein